MEKLRSKIECSVIKVNEKRSFSLTVSIGLSKIELDDINIENALYKSKKQGEN